MTSTCLSLTLLMPLLMSTAAVAKAAEPDSPAPSIKRVCVGTARDLEENAPGTCFVREDASKGQSQRAPKARLGDWLTLKVTGLRELCKAANSNRPVQLYLNGMPVAGVPPYYLYQDGAVDEIRFELLRTEPSKETWSALLGQAALWDGEGRETKVSVGLADCSGACTDMSDSLPIDLVALHEYRFTAFCGVAALCIWALVLLARTTAILRDHGLGSSWSLARTQMAWWTIVVVLSFLFIWIVTGSYSSLTNSVLALIGISAGTYLFGSVLHNSKEMQLEQREALEEEKKELEAKGAAADTDRLKEIDALLLQLPRIQRYPSSNKFWMDILSDENGISLHRFQMVVWTLALTAIFIVRVYATLSMPDFDAQLLGLTGISAGTYIGFKFPEKQV